MRTIYNHLAILTFAAAALLPNGVAVALDADTDGIMYLIREYCQENPLNDLANAAADIAEQLINRAGRR